MMKRLMFALLVWWLCSTIIASTYLFRGEQSAYRIVLPSNPLQIERTTAQELQSYFYQAGKVNIPISFEPSSSDIYIKSVEGKEDSYRYYTRNGNLYITGSGARGVLYAAESFLEQELGIHWLTPDCTVVPSMSSYKLKGIDVSSVPAFDYRLDFYYGALKNNDWCAHNLLNAQDGFVSNKYGNMEAWWGMHTFNRLLPDTKYYDSHPEYYSLRDGKRIKDGQLCLTNPDVLRQVTRSLLQIIQQFPDYFVYDVSQNDNPRYCECEKCQSLASKYGGQSGLMIWFVNQIAEQVAKFYPDKQVGTFAYRYTRQVPLNITPRSNVAIRLCSFECCFCHNLDACERNENFFADLKAWHQVTGNLYIWDYCVGFKQYVAPHPYFHALANRMRTYRDYGVKGILELGQYESNWGDFSELRQWVVAKLLWNPSQDVDSLSDVFIKEYYGHAASSVREFYTLTQTIPTADSHFTIYCDYKNNAFTDEYISKGRKLVDQALREASGNKLIEKRVKRVAAQIYYLQVMHYPVKSRTEGTLQQLRDIVKSDSTYFMEHKVTLDGALQHWGYI